MSRVEELVTQLATARAEEAALEIKYAAELMLVKLAKKKANVIEEELRKAAMENFQDTGDKQPHGAVSIKMRNVMDYQTPNNILRAAIEAPELLFVPEDVIHKDGIILDWFIDNFPNHLRVDNKAAKKLETGGATWLESSIEIQAYTEIKSALDEYLYSDRQLKDF